MSEKRQSQQTQTRKKEKVQRREKNIVGRTIFTWSLFENGGEEKALETFGIETWVGD